jgi:nucleoid-associated protein YgaU
MTYGGVVNYVAANGGSGGGGGYEWTSFIVGTTTGAPTNGDTSITISQMAGDRIEVYRGTDEKLDFIYPNETALNYVTGYRYTGAGQVVVKPAWATGDRAYIKAVASAAVTKDTLTGGSVSTLLTGLRAGFKFDELSGTQVNGVNGLYTGVTNATLNQSGKFGRAHSYVGASSQMSTFGIDIGDMGINDFSYSTWIYVPVLQSAYNGFLESQGNADFYCMVDADNYLYAVITFDNVNYINITSNSPITPGVWTSVIVVYNRDSDGTMFVNGVAQNDVEDISAHVAVDVQSNINFRIGRGGNSTWYFNGSIDDVYLWTKVLSQAEIDALQLATHPW